MGEQERSGSSFSVFRTGSRAVRGPVGIYGLQDEKQRKRNSTDNMSVSHLKLDKDLSRPQTGFLQSGKIGLRFGTYSQASFFSRHNPHPMRVRHISGLNGIPICSVSDHASLRVSRMPNYPRTFTPTTGISFFQLPAQFHGLHGLKQYPYKEKALPKFGIVPVTDSWREELRELCIKAGLPLNDVDTERLKNAAEMGTPSKRKTIYSEETGRIKPPLLRYTSSGKRSSSAIPYMHIIQCPDMETVVLEILCQILQTDSIQTIQQWLVSASEREKCLVSEIIETTLTSEYHDEKLAHTRQKKYHDQTKPLESTIYHNNSRNGDQVHSRISQRVGLAVA